MVAQPDFTTVAALIADPTRGRMLAMLMDGRARTATELALDGGVTASTASSHLSRLTSARLLEVARQGRHRYYRIGSPEVAAAVEALMGVAGGGGAPVRRAGPRDEALRQARVCYDHLAGEVGVRLLDRLMERGHVRGEPGSLELTVSGAAWCEEIGLEIHVLRGARRPLCRGCLDWSERRMHLGGSVGAALLGRLLHLRLIRRVRGNRAVVLTPRAEAFVEHLTLS